MNVTFLNSSGAFAGVEYNLKKVNKGEANILESRNFIGLKYLDFPTMKDYTNYLKDWSARNSRVKDTQLHVAISCKGRHKTQEELLEISKEWLDRMGYKNTPALFVFHKDTDNNHIHIVTSRIDENGLKIKDSFEQKRGRAILLDIVGLNLEENALEDLNKVFEYRFDSIKQFQTIFTSMNYRAEEDKEHISFFKEGKKVLSIPNQDIQEKISNNKSIEDSNRIKQLRSIILKYKEELPLNDMKDYLKSNLGIELVFFGNKDKPYGYTVIDHPNKTVYKGGDIIKLKDLLNTTKSRVLSDDVNNVIQSVINDKDIGYKKLNAELKGNGLFLKYDTIYKYGKVLGTIDNDLLDKVKDNELREFHQLVEEALDNRGEISQLLKGNGYSIFRDNLYLYGKSIGTIDKSILDKIHIDNSRANEILKDIMLNQGIRDYKLINKELKKYGLSTYKDTLYHYGSSIGEVDIKGINRQEKDDIENLISSILDSSNDCTQALNKKLREFGVVIHKNSIYKNKKLIGVLSEDIIKNINENDRVEGNNLIRRLLENKNLNKLLLIKEMSQKGYRIKNNELFLYGRKLGKIDNDISEKLKTNQGKDINTLVRSMLKLNSDYTTQDLNRDLRANGASIVKGVIYFYGKEITELDEDLFDKLKENNKLSIAKSISCASYEAREALADYFNVESDRLDSNVSNEHQITLQDKYDRAVKSERFWDYMNENNLILITSNNRSFILDKELGAISEVNTLSEDYAIIRNLNEYNGNNASAISLGALDDILSIIDQDMSSSEDNRPKKRRR